MIGKKICNIPKAAEMKGQVDFLYSTIQLSRAQSGAAVPCGFLGG